VMSDGSEWFMSIYRVFSELMYNLVIGTEPCHKSGSVCKLYCQVFVTCTLLQLIWYIGDYVQYFTVIASVLYLQE
jgi:hypothetical protein